MDALKEIVRCEVCNATDLRSSLNLGDQPLCDDLISVGSVAVCKAYPIEILFCRTCVTAHQRFQVKKEILFPRTYHYRARHTADVLLGMRELVKDVQSSTGSLAGKAVLDVGCNDGSLLNFFREAGARTFGIEPTGAAADAAGAGHVVLNDYFAPDVAKAFKSAHGSPDIVTFTNVFAHIDDIGKVIEAIRILSDERTLVVIENHYLGAILDRDQFDTFYHEHPRTYSATSFQKIASSLNMSIQSISFPARYGGNIRVVFGAGTGSRDDIARAVASEQGFGNRLDLMQARMETWRNNKSVQIGRLTSTGPITAKAFPGRAAIPLRLLATDVHQVACVYEKSGSAKIGHYVPGTRIPIVSDDEFNPSGDAPMINLAWHISHEINPYMRRLGFRGDLIDIITPADFEKAN